MLTFNQTLNFVNIKTDCHYTISFTIKLGNCILVYIVDEFNQRTVNIQLSAALDNYLD